MSGNARIIARVSEAGISWRCVRGWGYAMDRLSRRERACEVGVAGSDATETPSEKG